jgi:hypothetical protein
MALKPSHNLLVRGSNPAAPGQWAVGSGQKIRLAAVVQVSGNGIREFEEIE